MKPEQESPKADMPAGQMPDSQEKITTLEETASEDTEHPPEVTTNQASSGTAPETIVGAMEAMLLQQGVKSKAAGLAQHTVTENDSAGLSRRHRLVVEAEQSTSIVNKQRTPAVFRLVIGLVLLISTGVAGWLTWLAWDEFPVAGTVASDSEESAVPSTTVKVPVIDPLRQENANNPAEQREAERLEQERQEAEKRLAEQREVERLERERQEAEKRLAELREAERLERERQEAEKRLAEQREAELGAKRAAALAAWKKANSGIGWAEEVEDESD
jgi:hypothetical protein